MLDLDAGNSLPVPDSSGFPEPEGMGTPMAADAADELLTIEQQLPQSPLIPNSPTANADQAKLTYYIQVVECDQAAILRTNLPRTDTVKPTERGVAWLLGRSRNCTIVFPDPAISRCHAVISYQPGKGFLLMDAGSSNGTFLNGQRLVAMESHLLQDRDVITISHIGVKLFVIRTAD